MHRIENELYRIEVEPASGAVRRLLDKLGNLELITEPRLGEAFRLLLPLPDQEANYILSKDQRVTAIEESPQRLTLRWDGPLRNERGGYDVGVTMFVEFVDRAIHFRLNVQNRTGHDLAEAWYPMLGGLTGIGPREETRALIPNQGGSGWADLFQNFPEAMGVGGGGGNPFPEFYVTYPGSMPMPWIDFYNPRLGRGLYFASHDPVARYGAARFEMHPGIAHDSIGDNWPRREELEERFPQGVVASWVKFPYTKPGETFEGPPVVVQCHPGDWHAAAPIYRAWFDSHFSLTDPKGSWLHREHAFQIVLSLLPEGNLILPFRGIPQFAKDGLAYGVKALCVCSWNRGGHDNMYPHYEPDPRLGSWDDLKTAIAECHAMGVKVFFFVNLQPVDLDTDWYRRELHRYMSMDKWGVPCLSGGWGMGTLGARLGYTRRAMGVANPAFPEFRKIIVDQMRRLAEIGADGLHFDKLGWHIGLDFNPRLPLSPDRAASEGILLAMKETSDACREVNPDFCLSVEHWWDRLFSYTDVAWVWGCMSDHVAALKYTFPQWMPMMPVVQPYGHNVVNEAVRYGYQIMIGAARYSRSMDDEPMQPLSGYIREILRIRKELEDTIYFGSFLDTVGVEVKTHADVRFSVHRNPRSGRRACVLVNLGHESRQAELAFPGDRNGTVRIHRPFQQVQASRLPLTLAIPPRRLAIVEESGRP